MIVHQRDQRWWFSLNGAARHAMVRGALNWVASPVVLTEYPKSGGSWMCQMLSEVLDIPYPRNRLPHLKPQILHGCFKKVHPNVKRIVLWRDGRDTMVSFYYHLMFPKPNTSARYSRELTEKLGVKDPYDIETYLPSFIKWAFEGGYPGFSWSDFVGIWQGRSGQVETSYEAMLADPIGELTRVLEHLSDTPFTREYLEKIVQDYSFKAQSDREPGEEDVTSFIRKGIAGDWKNVFNREACEVFQHYAGKELQLLGYEADDNWIDGFIASRNSASERAEPKEN